MSLPARSARPNMPGIRRRSHDMIGTFVPDALGFFSLVRGYADLRVLAEVSVPVPMALSTDAGHVTGNQRAINEAHVQGIVKYLQNGTARFLPEIVLSVRLEDDIIDAFRNHKKLPAQAGRPITVFEAPGITVVSPKAVALEEIRASARIRRIDGNHRLTAAERLEKGAVQPANKYLASFCVVLLGPVGEEASDNAEARVFHAVNSTAMPLDTEHALQLLLDQPKSQLLQADVEYAYDPILYLCRKWRDKLRELGPDQAKYFGDGVLAKLQATARVFRAIAADSFESRNKCDALARESFSALTEILPTLDDHAHGLLSMSCGIEAAALAWSDAKAANATTPSKAAKKRLVDVDRWITRHGLNTLEPRGSLARQMLDIHDGLRRGVPQRVFLARWYPAAEPDKARAERRLEQIRIMLEQVKDKTAVDLELVDMGTEEGGTVMIHPKMYEAIESADIILVDLTGHRPNVCVEAGYALRHRDAGRLLFMFQPRDNNDKVAFDLNTFRYEPLAEAADVPVKLAPHVIKIIEEARAGKLPAPAKS
ncbi:MAG: hypothetical protein DYG92_09080 [Leptolyngbya sp. PLA1]|nr:hypothetical protein [Leptolyngbya sp. PLA1]